jgi:hypothetical protein
MLVIMKTIVNSMAVKCDNDNIIHFINICIEISQPFDDYILLVAISLVAVLLIKCNAPEAFGLLLRTFVSDKENYTSLKTI